MATAEEVAGERPPTNSNADAAVSGVDDTGGDGGAASYRVKVYVLSARGEWVDKGTGHVSCQVEDLGLVILAHNEETNEKMLEHKVDTTIDYTRQSGTIITYTDNDVDYAISFQEAKSCELVWDSITSVRARISDMDLLTCNDSLLVAGDSFLSHEAFAAQDVKLPTPTFDNIEEIKQALSEPMLPLKEPLARFILETPGWLAKLFSLFETARDLDQTETLFTFYHIFKGMLLLHETQLLERLLSVDPAEFQRTLEPLEYDPDLPKDSSYTAHRDFLRTAKFKEVVPISDQSIQQRIHLNYRIMYIRDVVLLRHLDEHSTGALNQLIFYNNVAIMSHLLEEQGFHDRLFMLLLRHCTLQPVEHFRRTDPTNAVAAWKKYHTTRKDAFQLVKDLVGLAKTLAPQLRDGFYKVLVDRRIFSVLEDALVSGDVAQQAWLWLVTIDVLNSIVQDAGRMLRQHLFSSMKGMNMLRLMVTVVVGEYAHTGIAHQLTELIKAVLDPDGMGDDKEDFLDCVYEHVMVELLDGVHTPSSGGADANNNNSGDTSGPHDADAKADSSSSPPEIGPAPPANFKRPTVPAVAQYHTLEILTLCAAKHGPRMRSLAIHHNLLSHVSRLIRSDQLDVKLSALRFLRTCVGLKDEVYHRKVAQQHLLDPMVDAFLANGSRYNMLNSVVIEFVDFIRRENIKCLVRYLGSRHVDKFSGVTYVDTFRELKARYEQNLQLEEDLANGAVSTWGSASAGVSLTRSEIDKAKQREQEALRRSFDDDEYFRAGPDSDDDEDDVVTDSIGSSSADATGGPESPGHVTFRKRKRSKSSPPSPMAALDESKFIERSAMATKDEEPDFMSFLAQRTAKRVKPAPGATPPSGSSGWLVSGSPTANSQGSASSAVSGGGGGGLLTLAARRARSNAQKGFLGRRIGMGLKLVTKLSDSTSQKLKLVDYSMDDDDDDDDTSQGNAANNSAEVTSAGNSATTTSAAAPSAAASAN